jgi:phytoene desaturase
VVIGAGLGGLACAARLASQGHDVTVVESGGTVGGKLGEHVREGFRFDTGPSLVTLPAALRDLFLKTGRPLEESLDLVPVDPVAHYRFADGTELDAPNADLPGLCDAFDTALGPGAGADWQRFHAYAERLWDVTRTPFLESPLDGPAALARLALRRPHHLLAVAPWRSLRDVGRRFLRDPRQRTFLERYATYAGSDPRRAPAALAVIPYVEQAFGGWFVRGGLRRIVDAVHERALERGAVVVTGARASRITTSAGRVDGVGLADGNRLVADVVVANADATQVYGDLLPSPREQRRIARATPSLSGFVLLLGVRGRTPSLRHHTVLFGGDYDAEFDRIFGTPARPVDDPTLYVSVPPDAAPPGDEAWFVLANAPRQGPVDWDAPGVAAAYADHLLATLAARGHDVRDRLAFAEWRTPADLERATGAPGGAIYGTSSNGARAAFLRPRNRSRVPGLFLVGGSAHPGGGIPLVTLSAAIVAELVGPA